MPVVTIKYSDKSNREKISKQLFLGKRVYLGSQFEPQPLMLGKEARENLKQLVTLPGPQSEESNGCGFVPSVTIRFHLQFR